MSLEGQTILITGSTDGLGLQVAKKLAADGATVLLHGRDPAKVEKVRAELAAAGGKVEAYVADLASLEAVRGLAAEVLAKHETLNVLVNNAGLIATGGARLESADGYELHFAVNYLSHFLLTQLLLPALRQGAPARIVNVASIGQAPVDFDDLMMEGTYSDFEAYRRSKLAQIMFTFDLSERLKGTGVTAVALHPGTLMNTKMVSGMGMAPQSRVEDGTDAAVRLAVSPEMEGVTGVYYDVQALSRANDQAYDAAARHRLWSLSLQLCGLGVQAA